MLGIMDRFLMDVREHTGVVDDQLAGLVQAGRVGYVDVVAFTIPFDAGLVPLFLYPGVKFLQAMFPRLDKLGALRV